VLVVMVPVVRDINVVIGRYGSLFCLVKMLLRVADTV